MPPLETYYGLLASAVPGGFDAAEAARLELDWWQARREAVGPDQYGVTVARVSAIIYGKPVDDPSLLTSGIGRAEAMAYRDEIGEAMTDPDWSEVECRLRRAYCVVEGGGCGRRTVKAHCRRSVRGSMQTQKSPGRCRGF